MQPKHKCKVIADAFKRVSIAPLYRDGWITDWIRIINHAYGCLPNTLDTATLVKSLAKDSRFRGTTEQLFPSYNSHRPRKHPVNGGNRGDPEAAFGCGISQAKDGPDKRKQEY